VGLTRFDMVWPISHAQYFTDSDTTDSALLIESVDRPILIEHIFVSSNDSVDRVVQISQNVNGSAYPIGSITVPAGAGFGGVRCLDVIQHLVDPAIDGYVLKPGDSLRGAMEVTMTAGKVINFVSTGGELP